MLTKSIKHIDLTLFQLFNSGCTSRLLAEVVFFIKTVTVHIIEKMYFMITIHAFCIIACSSQNIALQFPTVWIIDICSKYDIQYATTYYSCKIIQVMYTDVEVKIMLNSCDSILLPFISNNDVMDLIFYFAIYYMLVKAVEANK